MTDRKPTDPAGRIACLFGVWLRRRTNLTNRLETLWRAHCARAWPLRVAGYHYIVYRRDSTIWLCDIALWLNERGI